MSEPLDINRRLTDDEIRTIFTSPMVSLTETYEAIALRFEVTRARREEDRLRLALETATRELETYRAEHEGCIDIWRKECETVKAERDAHLSKAPPPADAATEAVDLAALPVHFVSVLPRGHIFMHPDTPKSGVRDPWSPSTPAPAPSAKERTHCCRCNDTRVVPSRCSDPQCGDSTWDHLCDLGGEDPCPACAPSAKEEKT